MLRQRHRPSGTGRQILESICALPVQMKEDWDMWDGMSLLETQWWFGIRLGSDGSFHCDRLTRPILFQSRRIHSIISHQSSKRPSRVYSATTGSAVDSRLLRSCPPHRTSFLPRVASNSRGERPIGTLTEKPCCLGSFISLQIPPPQ